MPPLTFHLLLRKEIGGRTREGYGPPDDRPLVLLYLMYGMGLEPAAEATNQDKQYSTPPAPMHIWSFVLLYSCLQMIKVVHPNDSINKLVGPWDYGVEHGNCSESRL